jgi:hypothetical protein
MWVLATTILIEMTESGEVLPISREREQAGKSIDCRIKDPAGREQALLA